MIQILQWEITGAEKKNFAIDGLSIRSRFQNQNGPTQNSAVPLCPLRLPRPLALLPNLLRTYFAIRCQKVQKIRFLVICFIEYNYSILLTSNNFMLTRAVG